MTAAVYVYALWANEDQLFRLEVAEQPGPQSPDLSRCAWRKRLLYPPSSGRRGVSRDPGEIRRGRGCYDDRRRVVQSHGGGIRRGTKALMLPFVAHTYLAN